MDAQIKEALASAGLQEDKSQYLKLVNEVDSFMLPHKTASEVKLNLALAAKYAAEENESEANARLDDALTELNKTKNDEAKSRLPFVEMEVRSQIDDIRASAEENVLRHKKQDSVLKLNVLILVSLRSRQMLMERLRCLRLPRLLMI